MAYLIRPFQDEDAPSLATITLAAIAVVGAKSYTAEQVAAWSARHPGPDRFRSRVAAGDHIIVAADGGDKPVAYSLIEAESEDGLHLDMLYCHPDHTRKGLADQLLAASEQFALSRNATRLYTEASELARPAFERAGYTVSHRRDFTIPHEGGDIAIHNYAMEKRLA